MKSNDDSPLAELQKMYDSCVELLVLAVKVLHPSKDKELMQYCDIELFTSYAKILERDLYNFRVELSKIRKKEPKKFDIDNPIDVQKSIIAITEYNDWQEKYHRSIQPIMMEISTLLMNANLNKHKDQKVAN